jgi:hypothetical protein
MKNSIMVICAMFLSLAACKDSQAQSENKAQAPTSEQSAVGTETLYACSMHPEVTGKKGDKCSKCGMELTVPVKASATVATQTAAPADAQSATPLKEIVSGYLLVKNAFTADKTADAAAAGKALEATFRGFNKTALTAEQKKTFGEVEEDATEHAEHIGANGGNIEHRRCRAAAVPGFLPDVRQGQGRHLVKRNQGHQKPLLREKDAHLRQNEGGNQVK